MYDSKAIADLTDIVLCYIAEDRQGQRVLPRLVSRFYELHLALTPSAQTLTGFVHQHALARLQVMRFVAGDPAKQILHGANNARWSHIVNFATDLSEVMTDFETDIFDGIKSYMDIRMAMFAENEHELVETWNEEDAVAKAAVEKDDRGKEVWQNRDAVRLAVELRDARRLHNHLIGNGTAPDVVAEPEETTDEAGLKPVDVSPKTSADAYWSKLVTNQPKKATIRQSAHAGRQYHCRKRGRASRQP